MLFSNDLVAQYINARFEPAWEMVREVPIVRIDFGKGNVVTRTLHGNILTSVCTAEGQMLDALPGIYTAAAYLDQLNQFRLLHQACAAVPVKERVTWASAYHARQAERIKANQAPERFTEEVKRAPIGKALIERPAERLLALAAQAERAQAATKDATASDVAGWKELAEDTRLNESTRRRQIHELLADKGLVRPDVVQKSIYRDVLCADLDDPYLGLGKALFADYPFTREDATR